MVNVTVF